MPWPRYRNLSGKEAGNGFSPFPGETLEKRGSSGDCPARPGRPLPPWELPGSGGSSHLVTRTIFPPLIRSLILP
jgi:hypothetical protein